MIEMIRTLLNDVYEDPQPSLGLRVDEDEESLSLAWTVNDEGSGHRSSPPRVTAR